MGDPDNGFLPFHYPNNFSKFRIAHPDLSLNLLQVGWSNGRLAERGFYLCDDCLLVPLQAYLVSRETQKISVACDRFGDFQLFKKGSKNSRRYVVLQLD